MQAGQSLQNSENELAFNRYIFLQLIQFLLYYFKSLSKFVKTFL